MDDLFNEMQLPFANVNEELETISNNAFKPLFDIKRFEIRSESEKDKGIDFHIELKIERADGKSVHTNFRFAIQLKATENIEKNLDGSFSKQIDFSNVNYLLNTGMPAYYVLYHLPSKTFYYENVNDFLIAIESREKSIKKQQSYSLRFEKLLDYEAIEKIYEEVLKKGKFQRHINEKMTLRPSASNLDDKISFDADLNITDDALVRNAIEAVGLSLINKAKWRSVISFHKKASGNVASTPLYNLVLGMANYYNGNMFDALKYLKDADRSSRELSADMNNHLQYFYAAARYFFGIIREDEFNKIMDKLQAEKNIGLYVKLENAKSEYANDSGADALITFKRAVNKIIENSNSDEHIVINARREILFYEGVHNNMEFVRQCSVVFALEDITLDKSIRIELVNENVQVHTSWLKKMTELHNEAITKEDYFSFYNSVLIEVKIRYHFLSNFKILFDTQEKSISDFTVEMKEQLSILLEKINNTVLYFTDVGHVENQAASISLQYEILHFTNDLFQAEEALDELERIIDIYDSKELKSKLEKLKDRGTNHESFMDFVSEGKRRGKRNTEMINQFVEEMKKMDQDEIPQLDKVHKHVYRIHLFPIGYFMFPKAKIEDVLEVLNVEEVGKDSFRQLFGMVIPVVNILNETVQGEGFSNGKADVRGITSWQNIYRIRKYFYENNFYSTTV